MADFPTSIFDQRTISDIPGVVYDETKQHVVFAEDVQKLGDEVTAIENALGENLENVEPALGFTPENVANKSTTLSADQASNTKYPSVKSVYDWAVGLFQTALGFTPENVANKDTDGTLSANSDTKYASQKATKTYADTKMPIAGGTFTGDISVPAEAYASGWNGSEEAPTKDDLYDIIEWLIAPIMKGVQAMGGSLKVAPLASQLPSTTGALSDGTAKYFAVYISRPMTITGFKFLQAVQGSYTADQTNEIALYSQDGAGTLTQLATTGNDGNLWKATAGTWQTKALSSPYVISTPGIYYIGCLYNSSAQTTAPQISAVAWASGGATVFDMTNSSMMCGTKSSTNSLPASIAMSTMSSNSVNPYIAMY